MSCGKDLLRAFSCIGLQRSRTIDIEGDSLDWYFECPEIDIFLKKFCSSVDSGLVCVQELQSELHDDTNQPSLTPLLRSDGTRRDIKEEIEAASIDISYKEDYIALLKQKLHHLKKLKKKDQEIADSLKCVNSQSMSEIGYLKQQIPSIVKQITEQSENLVIAKEKLLTSLSNEKENKSTNSSVSDSLSFCKLGLNEIYLEKEESFATLLQEYAELAKVLPKENFEPKCNALLKDWQNEHTRIIKSFSTSIYLYNLLRGKEKALLLQIASLKEILTGTSASHSSFLEMDTSCERLEESFCKCLRRTREECEELALQATAPLVLANYCIKLQRLDQCTQDQIKVLDSLRTQLCRWTFVQLFQKVEVERDQELLLLCHNVEAFLQRLETSPQRWIDDVEKVKKSQEKQVTDIVPIGDTVMECMADVLDAGKDDLICTFTSIVESAKSLRSKVNADKKEIAESRRQICAKLQRLQMICDILNQMQSFLTPETDFHGNLRLQNAMSRLSAKLDLWFVNMKNVHDDFIKFKKNLEMCPRDVFERNQKMNSVFKTCGET